MKQDSESPTPPLASNDDEGVSKIPEVQVGSRFGTLTGRLPRQGSANIAAGSTPAPPRGAAVDDEGSAKGGGESEHATTRSNNAAAGIVPAAARLLCAPFTALWGSGVFCGLAEGLMLAVSGLIVSIVPSYMISSSQLTFMRCFLALIFMLVAAGLGRADGVILYRESGNIPTLIFMGFFNGVWLVLFFQSVQYASLGDATVLTNATVLSAAGGWLLLGEKLSAVQLCGVGAVTVGLVLVIQPTFLFGGAESTDSSALGLTLGVISGISSAAVSLASRVLGQCNESALTLSIWNAALGCVVAAPFIFVLEEEFIWPFSLAAWGVCVIAACAFVLSAILFFRCLALLPAGVASALISSEVPFAYILGLLFLSQAPSYLSLLGMAIVMASILAVTLGGKEGEAQGEDKKPHSPAADAVASASPKHAAAASAV